ncbi:hypothetical protein BD414DRAFT_66373 [Trametes punicea]|nr:hypothetical protein BD414DRAFT_66373 [Trametes punicea]
MWMERSPAQAPEPASPLPSHSHSTTPLPFLRCIQNSRESARVLWREGEFDTDMNVNHGHRRGGWTEHFRFDGMSGQRKRASAVSGNVMRGLSSSPRTADQASRPQTTSFKVSTSNVPMRSRLSSRTAWENIQFPQFPRIDDANSWAFVLRVAIIVPTGCSLLARARTPSRSRTTLRRRERCRDDNPSSGGMRY